MIPLDSWSQSENIYLDTLFVIVLHVGPARKDVTLLMDFILLESSQKMPP